MLKKVFAFYYDGFRSMVVGRTLWKLIIIKLFIMFAILKTFFFPDFLATNFSTDVERADHVLQNLTRLETGSRHQTAAHIISFFPGRNAAQTQTWEEERD